MTMFARLTQERGERGYTMNNVVQEKCLMDDKWKDNERAEAEAIIMRLDKEQLKDVITYLRCLLARCLNQGDQQ